MAAVLNDSCAALQDEIARLEEELRSLDNALAAQEEASTDGSTCTAAPQTQADAGSSEVKVDDPAPVPKAKIAKVLKEAHRADNASPWESAPAKDEEDEPMERVEIPFRKVAFREAPEPEEPRDTRWLRWLGAAVLVGSGVGLWMLVIQPMMAGRELVAPVTADDLVEDLSKARKALSDFYGAKTLAEVLQFVRAPESLGPVVTSYHLRHPLTPRETFEITDIKREHYQGVPYVLAVVNLPDVHTPRQVALEIDGPRALVDWELATNAQKEEWESLLSANGESEASRFRVSLERDDYFNHGYDQEDWLSYRLAVPGVDQRWFAYAAREGELGKRLRRIVALKAPQAAQVIVSVVVENQGNETFFRIVDLVSEEWLLPTRDLPLHPLSPQRLLGAN